MRKQGIVLCSLIFLLLVGFQPEASAMDMKTIEGQSIKVPAQGRKTIIHFWTSWCPPCREELPRFQSFYDQHQSDVQLITINLLNAEQNERAVKQFIKANQLSFPIVFDRTGEMMKKYKVITIPSTFFLNEKGKLEKSIVGPITVEQMKTWSEKKS
ncbi:endospore biogenesis thiol-disulfide oxidoreductase StoA [Bacillus sp. CLL-7-23]|uniref:Endospore biogenesis thiol-disulfide oxidoreductase StoA n=1 Tax=Bacillus changyiensis TaxID=3004103 RepID=A0ABT4X1U3_9BACI|nr:endospore biogenesis thiol-disulfide oxidoreductase StoA [Bacillus changyiensis]MDA7026236.1 endospore biogenesis thiol-disulfide oxidoreductase StoA [Bacillus changyiensis]